MRRVLSIVFGLLAGFCLAELIALFGAGWFYHGSPSWLAGILVGLLASLALSISRCVLRQLRIQLAASRAGYLSLIAVGLGLALAPPSPAEAQTIERCEVVVTHGDGPSVSMLETTPGRPLEVDPSNTESFRIEWGIPEGADDELTMVLSVRTIGLDNVIHEARGNQTRGVYFLRPKTIDVAPGVYQIAGELKDRRGGAVCASRTGYVRILGSPWSSRHGALAAGGLLLGLAGTGLAHRFPPLDLWSFTTAAGVTIEIVNPQDGKTVRGPLSRGQMYTSRTTIEFPDSTESYSKMPGPIEVSVAVLGGTGSFAPSSMQPKSGPVSVENSFTVPLIGETMELMTEVSVEGNVVQSVRIVEQFGPEAERARVSTAFGQIVYKAGSWAAEDLCSMRPADATVMLHGNADGSAVEAWTYGNDLATGRRTGRNRIEVATFAKLSHACRGQIERCIEAGWLLANDETTQATTLRAERDDALRRLATVGAELRAELLGQSEPIAPFDGVIQVAHDTEVTGSSTFPWAVLYEGPAPHGNEAVCFKQHSDGLVDHGDGIVCVGRFWGLSYEVSWPNGWVPTQGVSERPGLMFIRRIFNRSPRLLSINRIRNRKALIIHSADNVEFEDDGGIGPNLPEGVAVSRTIGQADFVRSFNGLKHDAEIIHLFGHGRVADNDFALALDQPGEQLLVGADLLRLADGQRFERGPLVFLNACESGAIALSASNSLVDAFRTMGARAVVVTESRVDADEAIVTIERTLREVLAGDYVSRAIRSARRESIYQESNLSSLSFTFYGPCGLRLTNPIIDLTSKSPKSPKKSKEADGVASRV